MRDYSTINKTCFILSAVQHHIITEAKGNVSIKIIVVILEQGTVIRMICTCNTLLTSANVSEDFPCITLTVGGFYKLK